MSQRDVSQSITVDPLDPFSAILCLAMDIWIGRFDSSGRVKGGTSN